MDMSFTKDPDWIYRREVLWKETVKKFDIGNGSPQERVERLHTYFLTGELVDGEPRDVRSRLFYFPTMSIEAIEHVLKYNMPEHLDDSGLEDLKLFFPTGIEQVPGINGSRAAEIFRFIHGDVFDSERALPLQIGEESFFRLAPLDPNHAFAAGATTFNWLRDVTSPRGMWGYLNDYWFSLASYVDPILFRTGDKSRRVRNTSGKITQRTIRRLMGLCAHRIDVTNGAEEGEERREYIRQFRERIESLTGPSDMLALWESVKLSDPEEFR